ncbi:tRNA-dihydrouridine synthase 1 [Lodderomyces elongisporus NRRL YB-4239]|uniref:tRNA-dihydrouridine(16/17) synthase [NAD(P)(+)] n=1 Tax=Lodderomyces elongisporus (strain ATCC 11503 / CBS 2605 / JCM 1781 / NBRC 1676 / NRRL YB-4239) TaxID=379508 RepID=A5DYZ4_LODEL|nr:tRNA-dihydrouridine synthase 1 [Lodderomyces elongisporus NRRL YB-4239]
MYSLLYWYFLRLQSRGNLTTLLSPFPRNLQKIYTLNLQRSVMTPTATIANENFELVSQLVSKQINQSLEQPSSPQVKMLGRQLYNSIGQPKTIVAPMVDHSELAWRILSRRYGADLCYTPMFHSRLFATDPKYRQSMWNEKDGSRDNDRPLIVQFCANDPDYLLQAAKLVENQCDAVDLNLGCPQGIARRGKYGAFLMDDWELVHKLIRTLHDNLSVPVTAKIRVYDDWEKSLEYAKMVLDAGAQFITIHGRTREMKGQNTGLADWKILKHLRDNLPEDQVFFANGNILYPSDLKRCADEVGCDAVMSAEGNLYNPGVFWTKDNDIEKQFPRVDKLLREYFEIVKEVDSPASTHVIKSHFFKLLNSFLKVHTELRPKIGGTSVRQPFEDWNKIVEEVEQIVEEIYNKPNIKEIDVIEDGPVESWGGHYKKVPYWRCQPYFRKINGEMQNTRMLKKFAEEKGTSSKIAADSVADKENRENGENGEETQGETKQCKRALETEDNSELGPLAENKKQAV